MSTGKHTVKNLNLSELKKMVESDPPIIEHSAKAKQNGKGTVPACCGLRKQPGKPARNA
jgi:hypothetical protein